MIPRALKNGFVMPYNVLIQPGGFRIQQSSARERGFAGMNAAGCCDRYECNAVVPPLIVPTIKKSGLDTVQQGSQWLIEGQLVGERFGDHFHDLQFDERVVSETARIFRPASIPILERMKFSQFWRQ